MLCPGTHPRDEVQSRTSFQADIICMVFAGKILNNDTGDVANDFYHRYKVTETVLYVHYSETARLS